MKKSFTIAVLGTALLVGCAKKEATPQTAAEESPSPGQTPAAPAASQAPAPEVSGLMSSARDALKKDDQVSAVASLQVLRSTPNLSVDQYLAVQEMMGKAQSRLAERAARGDPQAIAALKMMQMNPPR